eukprot:TRINITY_DN8791_c0_g1_i1.p2 TRINITY_DN8791_c0_g1~~TRINITY_DN8791_c0_g1_i1.p2  ORF type:complete len:406 (+),score=38.62 TRINITY_DN8791_c0_g1_i1:1498-2715(+)
MPLSDDSGFHDSYADDSGPKDVTTFTLDRCDTWVFEQAEAHIEITSWHDDEDDFMGMAKSRGQQRQRRRAKNKGRKGDTRKFIHRNCKPLPRSTRGRYRAELDVAFLPIDRATNRVATIAGGLLVETADRDYLCAYGFKDSTAVEQRYLIEDRAGIEESESIRQCYSCGKQSVIRLSQRRKCGSKACCSSCIELQLYEVKRANTTGYSKTRNEPDIIASRMRDLQKELRMRCQSLRRQAANLMRKELPLHVKSVTQVPIPCFNELAPQRLKLWTQKMVPDAKFRGWSAAQIRRARKRGHVLKGSNPDRLDIVLTLHGTHAGAVESIDRQGLKIAGTHVPIRNGTSYGNGIYSSTSATTAWHYGQASRQFYACAVLQGQPAVKAHGNILVATDERYILPVCRLDCK